MSINASLTVHADRPGATIQPEVYGHFAEHLGRCIYEGIWVGEDSEIQNTRGIRNDVVAALRQLKVPVLRWPGGCFADEYHWKDGIGPREDRPSMINTHWGGVVENNHFGTHEFLDLCEQIGTAPYICGNVGSGSPQEMMEWVEYLTSDAETPMTRLRRQNGRDKAWDIQYFGVGNESWGCGGSMRPEFYADNFRRFNTFVKNHDGKKMYRIACGSNEADYRWTEVLMEYAGKQMNGLSLHHYTLPTGVWSAKGSATVFDETLWHSTLKRTLRMDELIQKHGEIMDRFDPEKRVGMIIDEWGTWYDVEPGTNPGFLYQQNTIRDALVAALNFHIFHRYADRVTMTNIAQTVNVLQTMILTDKEKMVLTPTYHVFEMFKGHQGGTYLPITLSTPDYRLGDDSIPAVSASASRSADGGVVLSLAATSPAEGATITLSGVPAGDIRGRILTAETMQSHNTFEAPSTVQPADLTDFVRNGDTLTVTLPSMSVAVLEIAG
jgi:alpha-N-arabinofuranosidase